MLIQLLVGVAILGSLAVGFAKLIANQSQELRYMTHKMTLLELEKVLAPALADNSVCMHILNNPTPLTFDSRVVTGSSPQSLVPVLPVYASVTPGSPTILGPVLAQAGASVSPSEPDLLIGLQTSSPPGIALELTGAPTPLPTPGPGVQFSGRWLIRADPQTTVRAMRPVAIAVTVVADTTNPASARVTSCGSVPTPPPSGHRTSCPAGSTLIGTPGTAEVFCISTNREAALPIETAVNRCYNHPLGRARLCSPSEWMAACTSGQVTGMASGSGEFVASTEMSSNAMRLGVAGTCSSSAGWLNFSSLGFRCCFR